MASPIAPRSTRAIQGTANVSRIDLVAVKKRYCCKTQREADRQKNRQTKRRIDRQTDRQTERQTDRQTDKERKKNSEGIRERKKYTYKKAI